MRGTESEHGRHAVKADAVAGLRNALVSGAGIADSVRACWYRHPLFASTLMSESLRLRYSPGCDIRLVTAFVARIRNSCGGPPGGFPSREAEAVIRACLGEVAMLDAVPPAQFSYPEIGIAILSQLLTEWRPGRDEVLGWFEQVEAAMEMMIEGFPALGRDEDDWFAAAMHQSPFAMLFGGVTPQRTEEER